MESIYIVNQHGPRPFKALSTLFRTATENLYVEGKACSNVILLGYRIKVSKDRARIDAFWNAKRYSAANYAEDAG